MSTVSCDNEADRLDPDMVQVLREKTGLQRLAIVVVENWLAEFE